MGRKQRKKEKERKGRRGGERRKRKETSNLGSSTFKLNPKTRMPNADFISNTNFPIKFHIKHSETK